MNPWVPLIILAVVVVLPLVWFIATYNALVRLRQYTAEAWSGIDTELKRRYDLIPNLVATVKGYARHEREVLESVTRARDTARANQASPAAQAHDENELVRHLRRLLAVAEAYPRLRADRHFLALQEELVNTEDRIQAARRFYNANVRDLNTRIQVLPSNVVAGLFGFQRAEFFEIDDARARDVPRISPRGAAASGLEQVP